MQSTTQVFRLSSLPMSAKVLLTLFLVLIASGYLSALGNLYHQHQMADGREGLTLDDLRVTFHGMEISAEEDASSGTRASKSRMKQMIEPGGEMRKQVSKGGPPAIRALEAWLDRGALEAEFSRKGLVEPDGPSADDVIARHCLRCHNADDGEKEDTPYGPDLFTTDYSMVFKYAAPGTAKPTEGDAAPDEAGPRTVGPHSAGHLFLITHIHMLSIPVFTLIVSGLFLVSGWNPRVTGALAPVPMLTLTVDFLSWWLALWSEGFIYVIATAGAVYGACLAVQLIAVLVGLWSGHDRHHGPIVDVE